ncbi:phage tail assembly chaperone [Polaromonas sp. P2-4]|nr:phage tail assembly chaperone [Polaromonas sp. P2-4]
MAFKRTQNPTFTTPVTVNVPNEKGGFDKSTFVARFKRTTTDETAALREMGLSNKEVVRRQLTGWELKDADTQEDVPFTQENLEALLQIEPTPLATALAFWEAVNGARSKN